MPMHAIASVVCVIMFAMLYVCMSLCWFLVLTIGYVLCYIYYRLCISSYVLFFRINYVRI